MPALTHPLIASLATIQRRERLSQGDMASLLEISRSLYSRLLAGEVQPTVRVVREIARAYPELRDACAAMVLGEDQDAPAPVAGAAV